MVRSPIVDEEIDIAPGIVSVPDTVVLPLTVRSPDTVVVASVDVPEAESVVADTDPANELPVMVTSDISEPLIVPPVMVESSIVTAPKRSMLLLCAISW